ncbi:MAG: T9SS type A sorting domain-containing protein [Bacteroidota bacterium]
MGSSWLVSSQGERKPLTQSSGHSPPYPNPTAESVTVPLVLAEATEVEVTVYDVLGRRVATLAEGRLDAGSHTCAFSTSTLAPGLYLVRALGLAASPTRTFTIVR